MSEMDQFGGPSSQFGGQLNDEHTIDTPELVAIDMPLAGIGSRFVAILIDYLIWFFLFILYLILLVFLAPAVTRYSRLSENWLIALNIFLLFLMFWGYFTLFEAFWNGRTPGKRVARIRVIQKSGRPIGFVESLARNLVRYVDLFPGVYAVGVITMFASKYHQRLGDMVAGTLVVRDIPEEAPLWNDAPSRTFTPGLVSTPNLIASPNPMANAPMDGLNKLGMADLAALEGFFARRIDLDATTRESMALRLASAIRAKSGVEPAEGISVESYLEGIAAQLREVVRLQ